MRRLIALLLLIVVVPLTGAESRARSGYMVVVSAGQPVATITRDELSRTFLKKATRGPNGTALQPVDQLLDSDVRAAFSEDVHGRSPRTIRGYWQSMIFSGRAVPPVELDDDAEVMTYIRKHPNAIGYVSADAEVSGELKVVQIKKTSP